MATDPGNTGIRRLIKASGYSLQGLAAAFRHETAFRQELAVNPNEDEAYYGLANIYNHAESNTAKAIENYKKALQINSENWEVHLNLAMTYDYNNMYDMM